MPPTTTFTPEEEVFIKQETEKLFNDWYNLSKEYLDKAKHQSVIYEEIYDRAWRKFFAVPKDPHDIPWF